MTRRRNFQFGKDTTDLDSPATLDMHRRIIHEKPFLLQIFYEWYREIHYSLEEVGKPILELGAGGGFLSQMAPGILPSDITYLQGIVLVMRGENIPVADGTLKGIVMTNLLHHIPEPRHFLKEATRCVHPGGIITMIEPWVTPRSRLVYQNLHHEPFRPDADNWEFKSSGPLSGANGAVPWMIFQRDRSIFEREFPQWRIEIIRPIMPFRYLISGGLSYRSLVPEWSFNFWRWLENTFYLFLNRFGMFAYIQLRRNGLEP